MQQLDQISTLEFLLTQECVAQRLGVTSKTLEAWRCRGGGPPFIHVGRLVRYRPEDITRWLESRRRISTSEAVK